jgi:exopolysaccharide biosynthesis polyprenyl glycosylphosphotransferase
MIRRLLYCFELLLVSANFFAVYFILDTYKLDLLKEKQFVQGLLPLEQYLQAFWVGLSIWAVILWARSGYRHLRMQTLDMAFRDVLFDGAIFLGVFSGFAFFFKFSFLSRSFISVYALTTAAALLFTRWVVLLMARRARRHGYNLKNILLIGTGRRAQQFMSLLAKHPEWGYRLVGLLDREPAFVGEDVANYKVIGTLEDLPDLLEKKAIDEVYFLMPRRWLEEISKYVAYCEAIGVPATVSTDLFDLEIASRIPKKLEGMTYLTFETRLLKEGELMAKRAVDILGSLSILILTSPILILTALAVKVTSPGPIFFKQTRCGKNGRHFTLYKFRTMVVDAEKKLAALRAMNEMSGPVFKMSKDPRITPVGRFLRKISLDEFPQFWNVLKGDMSIVGPRPPLPIETEEYEPWQRRRLSMKPGITCIWQVSGRNSIGFEEWMGLDLRYIDRWSLWLDFKILLQTAQAVFGATGK